MKTLPTFAIIGALLLIPVGATQAVESKEAEQLQILSHSYGLSARTSNNSFYRLVSRSRRLVEFPQLSNNSQDLFPHRGSGRVVNFQPKSSIL
ncbi:MAG: hypothetical protein HC835_05575 [Oscillatoriales cyanobacterium RM2_1_1]|nr:hypothetical protein [Oscillatoriales cyanobacterium SM2_3_0]NJO45132.1 hypothetical protein [Oscillatoriales cyanobacterium RM2_1_1]